MQSIKTNCGTQSCDLWWKEVHPSKIDGEDGKD